MKGTDLTGQQFGMWVVLEFGGHDRHNRKLWLCQCTCEKHTKRKVLQNSLTRGDSTSCGCKTRFKNTGNQYDLSGEYGIGWTSNTNEQFYFDLEDYDLIKDYTWSEHKGYIVAHPNNEQYISLHRLVMGVINNDDYVVDHPQHNTKDNRKDKLRICKQMQNSYNRSKGNNNRSGVTGVRYDADRNGWRSYITYDKQRVWLGSYKDFDDAVKARKEAEERYFGTFSYDNSMRIDTI